MQPVLLVSTESQRSSDRISADAEVSRFARGPLRRFMVSMAPATWMFVDWLIIGLAISATYSLVVFGTAEYAWCANHWLVGIAFCAAISVAGLVFGLYERKTLLSRSRILVRSVLTLSLGVVLAFACLTVFFYVQSTRWVGLSVAAAMMLVAVPLRLLAHEAISRAPVRVLCVGNGKSIQKLVAILGRMHSRHYQVIGHVRVSEGPLRLVAATYGTSPGPKFRTEEELDFSEQCPYVGNLDDIEGVLRDHTVDEVVVGSELAMNATVGQSVAACLEGSCRVTDQTTFVEKLLGEVPAESISADWFLRADVRSRGTYDGVSRVLDVLVAGLGLLLTLPLLPLVVMVIRLDSPGAALFKQIRVGRHGKYFTIYKFRTMRIDAEKDGVKWADKNDSRVTSIGRFLRRSRIDELPQLLNILRGDMSLVGPRPERPEFVHSLEQLLPHYRLRHLIKPGLTGWAQIHYHYGSSIHDAHRKLCFDLYYLKHRSLELDVGILIRTLGTFVLGAH